MPSRSSCSPPRRSRRRTRATPSWSNRFDITRRRRAEQTLFNADRKLSAETIAELAEAGYWGLLIDPRYGGSGAPFARFAPFLTRLAMIDATTSAMASVHGCIGAVDPLRTFGNAEQKARLLPILARGEKISAFALTEPAAGSDLTALRTTAVDRGDHFEVNGEKLFITNAVPGRLIGLVVLLAGKPAVLIAELPEENEHFQIVRYGLYALKHAYNHGLVFNGFRVPRENLLTPPTGDGLTIAYHGLNLGRLALCAAAAGTMRVFLANLLPWAAFRRTYGQAIQTRELVQRRIGRLTALDRRLRRAGRLGVVADRPGLSRRAGVHHRQDLRQRGPEGSRHRAVHEDARRPFVPAAAICSATTSTNTSPRASTKAKARCSAWRSSSRWSRSTAERFFEPIGKALQKHHIKNFNPKNPAHLWKLRHELGATRRWSLSRRFVGRDRHSIAGMDRRLAGHVAFAQDLCQRHAREVSAAMSKYQLKLADRQCRMAELSQRVQDTMVILVTALSAHGKQKEIFTAAADVLCQDLRRKLTGERPTDAYFRDVDRLADQVVGGGFAALADVPVEEILMRYEHR